MDPHEDLLICLVKDLGRGCRFLLSGDGFHDFLSAEQSQTKLNHRGEEMDRGHTVLLVADELLHKVPEFVLLRHELNVFEVEGDGSSQETINQFPVKLVVVQVVVVVFPTLSEHSGVHTLNATLCQPIDVLAHLTVVRWRQ